MYIYSERLKQERQRLKLSQSAFAEIAGVTKLSQFNYEKGTRKPDAEYFERIAQAGADVLYIITGEYSKPLAQEFLTGEQLAEDEKTLLENYRVASPEGRGMLLASSKAIAGTARKLVIEDPNRSHLRETLEQTRPGLRKKAQG